MNPFKLLNVAESASPAEIIQAMAKAMQERKYPIQDIAQAQKGLIDPIANKGYRFINFINIQSLFDINLLPPEDISITTLEYKPNNHN
ncbi:MAG: hypothetical protein ABII74_07150 [Elusimicrobiota bacterium]